MNILIEGFELGLGWSKIFAGKDRITQPDLLQVFPVSNTVWVTVIYIYLF